MIKICKILRKAGEYEMKKLIVLLFLILFPSLVFAQGGFTQQDRERLIRVETTLKVFMEQTDKRFEQVDKRITELRQDMNERFDQMTNFLWIIVAIFTTLTAVVIGFAYWDRRTIIRKARDEAVEMIEREGRLVQVIQALRKLAEEDRKVADVLRGFGLL